MVISKRIEAIEQKSMGESLFTGFTITTKEEADNKKAELIQQGYNLLSDNGMFRVFKKADNYESFLNRMSD